MFGNSHIRVLMIVDSLPIGGTETHILSISKKLIKMGIYVIVCACKSTLSNLFSSNNIKVINFPINSFNENPHILNAIKYVIDEEKINLIHCHLINSMIIGSELAKNFNIPYIATIHGLFYPKNVLKKTLYNASSIIAVSNSVKKYIENCVDENIKSRIELIPNGIDLNENFIKKDIKKELNIKGNELLITYCSRLSWDKFTAAESLVLSGYNLISKCNYTNLRIVIIGSGKSKIFLEKQSNILNKSIGKKSIHVIGSRLNVYDYYLPSDIIVGTGRVALEALSCGKPVISVGSSGYVGIVKEDTAHLQYEYYFGDHDCIRKINICDLTNDLKYLIDNENKRNSIALWSKNWCEKFYNIDSVTNNLVSIYVKILSENFKYN